MKILGLIIAGALAAISQTAAAATIFMPAGTPQVVLNDWGNARVMPARNDPYSSGPVKFGNGVTFSSTSSSSVIGNTSPYMFGGNRPTWTGTPMAGLNAAQGSISFDFANPVASVLAEMNWAPNHSNGQPIFISIYNSANVLLETFLLSDGFKDDLASGYFGFTRNSADISRLVLTNGYVGIRDLYTNGGGYDGAGYANNNLRGGDGGYGGGYGGGGWGENPHGAYPGAVPEPGTWLLMIVGFGAIGAMLRRDRRVPGLA